MSKVNRHNRDWTILKTAGRGCLVGVVVGAGVSLFRWLIEWLLGTTRQIYAHLSLTSVGFWLWVAVMIGLAVIIGRWMKQEPMAKGSGIPQVEGQLAGDFDYAWWPVLWRKFVGGILAIGSGLYLGREGPSIQLGATAAQGLAEAGHLHGADRRIMIASGAAAGLSAAFNAPIAGTLFILEEVYHNFSPAVWLSSLTGAVTADYISKVVFGLQPVLYIKLTRSLPQSQYFLLLLLGIGLGLLGVLYQWVILRVGYWYSLLQFLPRYLDGIVPFLLVIPIGLTLPLTLGGGNEMIITFAQHVPGLVPLMGYFLLRFVFSMISYGSGLPGGIFLPILTLGALLGAIAGRIFIGLGWLSPNMAANMMVYAMAGYFAGISKAPFTAILLITEMVGTLQHLLPLAMVAIVAYLTVDVCGGQPIYDALLKQMQFPTVKSLHGPLDRFEFPLFEGAAMTEHMIRDLNWPKDAILAAVRRGDRYLIPHGDTVIKGGDTLVVVTGVRQRQRVTEDLIRLTKQFN